MLKKKRLIELNSKRQNEQTSLQSKSLIDLSYQMSCCFYMFNIVSLALYLLCLVEVAVLTG